MDLSREEQVGEGAPQMLLRPVGVVRNELNEPGLVAHGGDLQWRADTVRSRSELGSRSHLQNQPHFGAAFREVISELVIDDDLIGSLDGIEDFSHIMVLYWAHHITPEGRSIIKAHPMGRKDFPLVGIFSTCSPARPNPVCLTAVRLLERRDNVLKVEGLDAVDGTPLVDIKPYVPSYYAATDVKMADWMARIVSDFAGGPLE